MLKEAVYHVAHGSYAYPVGPTTLRVTLRAARGDLQQVKVIYKDRYQGRRAGRCYGTGGRR